MDGPAAYLLGVMPQPTHAAARRYAIHHQSALPAVRQTHRGRSDRAMMTVAHENAGISLAGPRKSWPSMSDRIIVAAAALRRDFRDLRIARADQGRARAGATR